MPGFRWIVSPDKAWPELAANYRQRIEAGVVGIAQAFSPQIETWLKDNAPWQDRTGNLRQALHTEVNHVVGQMTEIILAHGLNYGLWLEIRWGGRYSVISPALDYWGPRVWQAVVRMLS